MGWLVKEGWVRVDASQQERDRLRHRSTARHQLAAVVRLLQLLEGTRLKRGNTRDIVPRRKWVCFVMILDLLAHWYTQAGFFADLQSADPSDVFLAHQPLLSHA